MLGAPTLELPDEEKCEFGLSRWGWKLWPDIFGDGFWGCGFEGGVVGFGAWVWKGSGVDGLVGLGWIEGDLRKLSGNMRRIKGEERGGGYDVDVVLMLGLDMSDCSHRVRQHVTDSLV